MAHDVAGSPVTGHTLIASGDAHLANFGLFASPERRPTMQRWNKPSGRGGCPLNGVCEPGPYG